MSEEEGSDEERGGKLRIRCTYRHSTDHEMIITTPFSAFAFCRRSIQTGPVLSSLSTLIECKQRSFRSMLVAATCLSVRNHLHKQQL